MPWLAPQVATIDRLGNLFCKSCAEKYEIEGNPVWGECHFAEDDKCDRCSKQIEHVPTSKYLKIEAK